MSISASALRLQQIVQCSVPEIAVLLFSVKTDIAMGNQSTRAASYSTGHLKWRWKAAVRCIETTSTMPDSRGHWRTSHGNFEDRRGKCNPAPGAS
eukprot:1400420-Rhodomonas_salina.3